MAKPIRSQFWCCGIAVLTVAIALGLTLLLEPFSSIETFFFAAVAVSAAYGGLNAGLLAALLSTLAGLVLIPSSSLVVTLAALVQLGGFVLIALLVAAPNAVLKRARRTEKQFNRSSDLQTEESLALLDAFLASAPIGFAFLDRDRRYVCINENLAATHQLSVAEHLGKTVWDTLAPEFAASIDAKVRQVLDTGELIVNQDETGAALRAFDQPKSWLSSYFPVRSQSGEILGVGATVLDISDRRQAEAALRESEARYRLLFESNPHPMWVSDSETLRFLAVNSAAIAHYGYSETEFLRMTIADIRLPEEMPALQSILSTRAASHKDVAVWKHRKKDGTSINVEIVTHPISFANRQANLSIANDITDRVQLEIDRDRTLKLEQAARTEAERANRLKDEFLAVLSHELRSPLNPILGWSKLLRTGKLSSEKTKEALAVIERNATLQAQLIEDLLDVSRILQSKLVLNRFPIDLKYIVSAALETVRLSVDAKAIQLQTVIDPNLGQVLGDAARLQQVLWNLLSNAVKFTPERGQIEIRLTCADSQAQIQVIDTGRGISPEFLPHVFDYFRQADSSTTRNFGGLGLGLAIVRHIVELHEGTVAVASPGENQGATFTVRLPLLPASAKPDPATPISAESPVLSLKGVSILAVEDDRDTRNLLTCVLEQAGASVTATASTKAALSSLSQAIPDVLLSDIGMPEVDGYRLLQHIRALPPEQGGSVPAIALTAYVAEVDQKQALEAGFHMHLAKPIDPDQLIKAIKRLLQDPLNPCHQLISSY